MRIGFDISQTGKGKAGCGYFAQGLISHLAQIDRENQYVLYPTFGDHFWDPDWSSGVCSIRQPNFHLAPGHASLAAARSFWNLPAADPETRLGNPDVIHSNNFFCPTGLGKARLVYTLYDLSFLAHPEWTREENRTACFDGVFKASLYADFIIAISRYSREHFLEVFPHFPPERIRVVYPASRFSGSGKVSRPKHLPLQPERFWLSTGTLEPRKNHLRLLRAYHLLRADPEDPFPLVLAGGQGWLLKDLDQELEALDLRRKVILLGYVDDETLCWLYQNCFAFVYPSLFEGFGMPVLEAMSLGAPVIASAATSIPEIVGPAGILIDPRSDQAIRRAMADLFGQPRLRMKMKELSLARSSQFSWQAAASDVLESYREVLSRPTRFPAAPSGTSRNPGGRSLAGPEGIERIS